MGRPSTPVIESGFERIAALRHLERHWGRYQDPDFWMRLNPHLTVSEHPFRDNLPPPAIPSTVVDRALIDLDSDGFLVTPPVVADARMQPLREALDTLVARGIPSVFVCVYDEFYQCFQDLEPLLVPILGVRYRCVAEGFWGFRVEPGDPAPGGLTGGLPPHRDSMGPDPRILAGERPAIMNVWVALTDVTPLHSCLYVVPRYADAAFATTDRSVHVGQFRLQDIRAVPVQAGGVVAFSTHLAHWGSRSAATAPGPRMSVSMYFQRADVPPFDASVFDLGGPVPVRSRLRWIIQSLGAEELWPRFFPEV